MDTLIDGAFALGEGARCIVGRLHFVDLLAGCLYSWDGRELRLLVRSDQPVGVAAPVAEQPSWLAVAEGTGLSLYDVGVPDARRIGRMELGPDGARPGMRVNDGCCDPFGRFWIGTMPLREGGHPGSVYRVSPDGGVRTVVERIACPNGPAFGAAGEMYLSDTLDRTILRATLDPETGEPGPFRVFARIEGGLPDGLTVDEEGCLWVAVWGAGEVRRYDPAGGLLDVRRTSAAQPTSVCLMNVDGRSSAVVTTARVGLSSPTAVDGAVLAFDVDVRAAPATAWNGPDMTINPTMGTTSWT